MQANLSTDQKRVHIMIILELYRKEMSHAYLFFNKNGYKTLYYLDNEILNRL